MEALVLERKDELNLRNIEIPEQLGPHDVRIAIHTVGICGSDVHYYTHGKIGPFVVNAPMVLGHEAAGTVVEIGASVKHLKVGDRVCMEPGIPDPNSRASRLGMYNVDPAVVFWATPPIHGVLTPYVVHPANYTFKLPDNVSFAEGAMVERELPFVVGVLGDFSGDPTQPLRPLAERKFVQIDRDNFNDVMARMNVGLNLKVDNKLADDGSQMGVNLKFNSIDDFDPGRIVEQVPALKALLQTRNKLRDLMSKVDRSEELEGLLEQVLQNEEKLKTLSAELGLDKKEE